MNKIISVLLLLSLILTVFTGCKTKTKNEDIWPDEEEIIIDSERISKSVDYVYIPNDEIIGTWNVVDFVDNINDFDPDVKKFEGNDYLIRIKFFDIGTAALLFDDKEEEVFAKWTKGYLELSEWQDVPLYTIINTVIKNINNVDYLFIQWNYGEEQKYYVLKKASHLAIFSVPEYEDVRGKDIHVADFSEDPRKILTLMFNDKTIFPPKEKMPVSDRYQPDFIMEAGKNPGLGVRALHEQGITGEGVSVAIIDFMIRDANHPEYKDKIAEFTSIGSYLDRMQGPEVVSILVGETVGVAPGAKLYYYEAGKYIDFPDTTLGWKIDAEAIAIALDMIIEKNKTLPDREKIRVVSISGEFVPRTQNINHMTNGNKYIESVERAQEAGILVLDTSIRFGIIGSCYYNFNDPEDVTKCRAGGLNYDGWRNKTDILAPVCYRTLPDVGYSWEGRNISEEYSYVYLGNGYIEFAIPYAAGVFAMGWQVKPELTADEIVQILRDTAYVDASGYKYINPPAFIEYIQGLNH